MSVAARLPIKMEFPCGLCRQPLETVDTLKNHLKVDHEVVKYRLDLVVSLSTLSSKEEKKLVEESKKRLTGVLPKEEHSNSKVKIENMDKRLARESEEEELEILTVIEKSANVASSRARNIKEESCLETPPSSPLPTTVDESQLMEAIDDLDIEILEIINKMPSKTAECGKRIKLEPGVEKPADNIELSSATSIKLEVTEPQIEMVIDGVALTKEVEEEEEAIGEGGAVDESLPFCRLCYITFSSHADQLPHEQKVHSSEEDKKALNVDLTQLTLEDFSYNCNICNLKFLTRSSVVYHQKVEHRVGVERTAECEQCHKVMKPANLKNHMTTHQERNFACQLCHTKLSSKSNLKLHFTNRHGEDQEYLNQKITEEDLKWPCDQCDLKFVAQKFLDKHLRKHLSEDCKLCYKKFSSPRLLHQHEKGVHAKDTEYLGREILDSELLHKCSKCDKKFVTKSILRSHEKQHMLEKYESLRMEVYDKATKRYKCKFCYKPFEGMSHMVSHIELAHKSDLGRIHEKIITADLTFSCDGCDMAFISNDILEYHKNRVHTNPRHVEVKTKSEKCEHCPQAFYHHNTLRKHSLSEHKVKIAKKVKVFNCKLCDRALRGKGNLKAHIKNKHKTEEEVKALEIDLKEEDLTVQCRNCGKSFLNKNVLLCHNSFCRHGSTKKTGQSAVGTGLYSEIYVGKKECALCLVQYQTTKEFQNHILSVHKNFPEEIAAFKSLKNGEEISLKSQCKFCQEKLLNGHVLKSHYEKVHRQEENIKTWECEFCKKKFKPEKKRRSLFAGHMRDEHDLPEYNCLEAKYGAKSSCNKSGAVGNQAKQNFQFMMAKMLGIKS